MKPSKKKSLLLYLSAIVSVSLVVLFILWLPYSDFACLAGLSCDHSKEQRQLQQFAEKMGAQLKQDPDPATPPVLVYNKAFAQRFGLDPAKAIKLDKGLYGISMVFKKRYYFYPDTVDGPLFSKYGLNRLGRYDWLAMDYMHLFDARDGLTGSSLIPILFNRAIPLMIRYECYLNFYFDSNDPQVKEIAFPSQQAWMGTDGIDRVGTVRAIISMFNRGFDTKDLKEIQEPSMKKAMVENDYQLIERDLDFYYVNAIRFSPMFLSTYAPGMGMREVFGPGLLDGYRGHFKEFLPGITYLHFQTQCRFFKHISNKDGAWLWLLNSNYDPSLQTFADPTAPGASKVYAKDYRPRWAPDKSKKPMLSHFAIPPEITNSESLNKVNDVQIYFTPFPVYNN